MKTSNNTFSVLNVCFVEAAQIAAKLNGYVYKSTHIHLISWCKQIFECRN